MRGAKLLFVRFWASWFVALLLFGEQVRPWTDEQNRYFMFWEPGCWMAFGLLTVLMAAVGVLLDAAIGALGRPGLRKAYRFLFIVALVTGATALLPARVPGRAQQAIWVVLTVAALAAYVRSGQRTLALARGAALTFSPLLPILFAQMITWPAFAGPHETPRFDRTGPENAHPVVVIVFDELSVQRAMKDGGFGDATPNMRDLAAQSTVFTSAYSGYRDTEQSLPRFLFQTTGTLKIARHQPFVETEGRRVPAHTVRGLFDAARERGYNTAMVGAFLPYRFILGDKVDYVHAQTTFRRTSTLTGMAALTIFDAAADTWLVPGLSGLARSVRDRAVANYHVVVNAETHRAVRRILEVAPPNTCLFVHWNLPHEPFIFDGDGKRVPESHSAEAYMRQMRYTDSLLGEVLADLRARGRFDDALLVITADHSWRRDPDLSLRDDKEWQRRVPLIVKWPGQTTHRAVSRPVSQLHLSELLQAAMEGADQEAAAKVIDGLPNPPGSKTLGGDDKLDAIPARD